MLQCFRQDNSDLSLLPEGFLLSGEIHLLLLSPRFFFISGSPKPFMSLPGVFRIP